MFDFSKKLHDGSGKKNDNPLEIYESLDRASDKGPLRLSQSSILKNWYENYKSKNDIIVKLHTGQGKTLIGLLILQSKLNSNQLPVMYLCPNKFLVDQTCEQAKQFGIKFCKVDSNNHLPQEFLDAKAILITTVQMVFNGLTKFGLKQNSMQVDGLVLDDSHACIETIQEAFTIKIKREEEVYGELFSLFESEIEEQGQAKTEEIRQGEFDAFLVVPYWAWKEKIREVVKLLVKNSDKTFLLFVWDLIKDIIEECQCVISGTAIEISPYDNPLKIFGTFSLAKHRVFMSATTSNDAFFIKGLGVNLDVIKNPIKYEDEKWSGEKMILIPYFIGQELDNPTIVSVFGKERPKRKSGVVALVPSNKKAQHWERAGAAFPSTAKIQEFINTLKDGGFSKTIVLSNRYEGIDLPDDTCRILILDSKPISISLVDRLQESYRENSKIIDLKTAQKIEQGMGRAVRGEKDYCVVIITGTNLISILASNRLRNYFSAQTNKQISIGKAIGELIAEQATTNDAGTLLNEILSVSLKRDENWKRYYVQEMNSITEIEPDKEIYELLQLEKKSEELCATGQFMEAVATIQKLLDDHIPSGDKIERAYYLQEMARYAYGAQKTISNDYQIQAYRLNRLLLKPPYGIEFQRLKLDKKRSENIINWIKQFDVYSDLELKVMELMSDLSFGKKSDRFEKALHEIGLAMGFACEMPDKELKKGPDNLWNIRENNYILFECKNEVKEDRAEIIKAETGQMNTSCAWFKTNYNMEATKYILIIPPKYIGSAAGFNYPVEILTKKGLTKLKMNLKSYFMEYSTYDLGTITEAQVNKYLQLHKLTVEDILNEYSEKPVQKR
ncbi:MAG: DEAD/DEAH box helicase family protein [Bacteroidota bacterium]|nr:DEAD/DEAH box helicase family protein [Bacteroidota bacterium]